MKELSLVFSKKILDDNLILYYKIMLKEMTYHLFNKVSNDLTYKLYNRPFKNVFEYSVILSMLEITKHKINLSVIYNCFL